jgi:hypothetical protein
MHLRVTPVVNLHAESEKPRPTGHDISETMVPDTYSLPGAGP